MKKIYLSVVIPAYNEVENIRQGVLREVSDYLKKQDYSYEVVLANDGSTDDTLKLLKDFAKSHKHFKVLNEPHRGKAGIVIAGVLAARGEIILFTDMDQATPISQLNKVLSKFKESYDIVIGSRSGRKGASIIRKLMAYGFMILRSVILQLPFKDTQCGFKAFKLTASRKLFKKMKVYDEQKSVKGASVTAGFDLEVLYLARKLGLRVAEVPVEWKDRGHREEVSPIKDSWEGLKGLLGVRANALMGKYG